MSNPSESTLRSIHRLVEQYTPDGTLGRVLLGGPALILAPLLFLGGWTMLFGDTIVPLMLIASVTLVAGIAAFPIGVMVLWPVYLSLIGNLDSPEEYYSPSRGPTRTGRTSDEGDPEAVLKRRYAAGELDREEFERRLDDVMGTTRRGDDQSAVEDASNATLETSASR